MAITTFAAIDVGSFELELGIFEICPKNKIRQVDQLRHVIALGKDTYNYGKISYELVDEICRELTKFSDIMKSYKVADYRAYATSAMREAKNSQIILEQIRVRSGIEVKIISNSEQRLLSYKAIAAKDAEFNRIIQKGTAIVDVSFGSMQVSLFDKDTLISTQNLQLGVLRLRELIAHVQTSEHTRQALIEEIVDNELFTYRKMYLKDRDIKNLIGVGECILYLSKRNADGVQKERVSAQEFTAFYQRITGMTPLEVEENFGVSTEYASLLIPSAIIYHRIMQITGAEMFWIPGIRLCDGMAAEYAEENKLMKLNHNFSEDIIVTARNIAKRYKCNTAHCQAVEFYVLSIFDSTKKYHGLGKRERLLLQIAANLHACGKFISMKDTSECTYNIIMSTEIIGLSHIEREVIANVVKYHVQEFCYTDSSAETILIAKLVAVLRLANAMDRSHKQKLMDCKINVRDNELVISTDYEGDITLELLSFRHKEDFFEEIYGIRPVLKQKRRA